MIDRMRGEKMDDLSRINAKTRLLGFIASPSEHSVSPIMHNAALRKLGLNYAYLAFNVGHKELKDAITGFRAINIRGFSVSMPNKIEIIPLLDELSPEAKLIGAVNTVVNENGKFIGYNTDGKGYVRSLREEGVEIKGKKMTLLGAGGAATAIAIQAALEGISEIAIFNRQDEYFKNAEKIAKIINEQMENVNCKATVYELEDSNRLREEIASSDILTNATDVGMKPYENQSLIPDPSWLHSDLVVSDIVYMPRTTKLMEQAITAGCRNYNGLGMVLYQGAIAFELWTGHEMPIEYVKSQIF